MVQTIDVRIVSRHDIETNWIKAVNFIPLRGEIIIYDAEVDEEGNTLVDAEGTVQLPEGRTIPYTFARIKIGDGKTVVTDLPFTNTDTKAYVDLVRETLMTYIDNTLDHITAEAAIADGNGNVIVNTYIPKPNQSNTVQVYVGEHDGTPMYVALPFDKGFNATARIVTVNDTDQGRIYGRNNYSTVADLHNTELTTTDMVYDIINYKFTDGSAEQIATNKVKIGNTELNETQLKKILAFIESIEG